MISPCYSYGLLALLLFCTSTSMAASSTQPSESRGAIAMKATGGPGVKLTGIDARQVVKGAVRLNNRDEMDGPPRAVEFSPKIDGWCEVWIQLPNSYWPATAKGMGVEITHAGGTEVMPAQPRLGGNWYFFGVWKFTPQAGSVRISNEGVISTADIEAVKFIPTDAPPQQRGPRPLPAANDDFDRMRDRWLDILTGPPSLDETDREVREMFLDSDHLAMTFWSSMNRPPEKGRLWPDMNAPKNDYSAGGQEANICFDRLRRLALAYAGAAPQFGYGAKMRGNPDLKRDILAGFDFMLQTAWNEQSKEAARGWLVTGAFIPRYGAECLLALGDPSAELREQFMATALRLSPTPLKHTGANRLFWVTAHAAMGVLAKDAQRLQLARDGMNDPLQFTVRSAANPRDHSGVDGMYADGSFIQHRVQPYNHGYGTGMVKQLAETISLFEGSPWEIPAKKKANLVQYEKNGVIPLSFRGQWFRRVTGRAVSSYKDERPTIESNLEAISSIAPKADRGYFMSVLKAMLEYPPAVAYEQEAQARLRRQFGTKLPAIDFVRKQIAVEATSDRSIKPADWFVGARIFPNMDMAAYQRPTWAGELSMSSTRIATHESFYGNNKKGWYLGDGMLRLHTLDYRLYLDNYWPTHDPYHLPGTTVDTRQRDDFGAGAADIGKPSASDFAGGAAVADRFAVAGMELQAAGSSLKARKAWFFFDDQIVCLGSGITASDGRAIHSTVEQMKLNEKGDNPLFVDGKAMPADLGWTETLASPRWAHLAGNTPDSGVGYYFPRPAPLLARREARSGAWTDIGPESKNDPAKYTRNYAALWFDHGVNPTGGDYQYVLLPGTTAEQVKAYAAKPSTEVIACSPGVSAARDGALGVTAAVFWENKPASAGIISCNAPACVIVWQTPREIRVAVSDPTQKNTGAIEVKIALPAGAPRQTDPAVKASAGETITLIVSPKNADGRAFETVFPR